MYILVHVIGYYALVIEWIAYVHLLLTKNNETSKGHISWLKNGDKERNIDFLSIYSK